MSNFLNCLIFLHFVLISVIILMVIMQRSGDSSILVNNSHFSPGQIDNIVVKITKYAIIFFMINGISISYVVKKIEYNKKDSLLETLKKDSKNHEVPIEK